MRREPSARLQGGKRHFSADGAEARGYNQDLGHILIEECAGILEVEKLYIFQKMVSQSSRGFHHMENRNRIPIYGYSFAQAKSGSADEVRASVAKL